MSPPRHVPDVRGMRRRQSLFPHLVHAAYLSLSAVSTVCQSCRPIRQRQSFAMRSTSSFEDAPSEQMAAGLTPMLLANEQAPARCDETRVTSTMLDSGGPLTMRGGSSGDNADPIAALAESSTDRVSLWRDLANEQAITAMAEIGVFRGAFSAAMLEGCPSITDYFMIDLIFGQQGLPL